MKKTLGFGVLLIGVMIFAWRDRAPEPATVEPLAPIALPDLGQVFEPLEPIRPPVTMTQHWGPCGARQLANYWEEEALRRVLASKVENDPLFGTNEMSLEAAECAAKRWREEGR